MNTFADPNDRFSYEDWMNSMATDDSKPARGWQAQHQPRCDCCGRFVLPGTEGGSWVMVPATDWNAGDERERCAKCTAKHGMAHCGPGYVEHLCCGMNNPSNAQSKPPAESGSA